MKTRRSLLKMLGLGAVAAPVAAKMVVEAPADLWPTSRVMRPDHLAAQQEINRRRSAALKMLNNEQTVDDYGERMWVDWARAAVRANNG